MTDKDELDPFWQNQEIIFVTEDHMVTGARPKWADSPEDALSAECNPPRYHWRRDWGAEIKEELLMLQSMLKNNDR